MAIQSTDIAVKLSTRSGTAGGSLTQTDPNASLGLYISTTVLTDNTLDNLFSDITGAENAAGQTDYRCLFVHNQNSVNSMLNPIVWISNKTVGGASIAIAIDNLGPTALNSTQPQAATINSSTTAPTGTGAFSAPNAANAGIALSATIGPGQVKAVWIRRTAVNSAALNNDSFTLNFQCDTTA